MKAGQTVSPQKASNKDSKLSRKKEKHERKEEWKMTKETTTERDEMKR